MLLHIILLKESLLNLRDTLRNVSHFYCLYIPFRTEILSLLCFKFGIGLKNKKGFMLAQGFAQTFPLVDEEEKTLSFKLLLECFG